MSSTTIDPRKKGSTDSSRMAATLDLELWERTSDGLIFFDIQGNFVDCSLKMRQLAGSAEAAREAFAGLAWPREFAGGGELLSVSRRPIAFTAGEAEVLCARTADGFIAAIRIGKGAEERGRNMVRDIFSAQLVERRAISRHLHGVLTQDLVVLSLSLSGLREEGNARLSEAIAYVDRCCRGVRALSYVLAPPSFLDLGLIETIQWYAGVLRADAGIDFEVKAPPIAADPPEEIKDLFFAGLQQMAAGAIWHSGGSAIRAALTYGAGMVSIHIECVCPPDEAIRESPLIRERARALAGWTLFTTSRRKTSLEISVPWTGTE
jgi:signal transduction histidine kinase